MAQLHAASLMSVEEAVVKQLLVKDPETWDLTWYQFGDEDLPGMQHRKVEGVEAPDITAAWL